MTHLPISLILLALVASVCCQQNYSAGGYDQVVIAGNHDPQSCLLRIAAKLYSDHIDIIESVYDPLHDCTLQNLKFVSVFNNQVLGELAFKPYSNPESYIAQFNMTIFQQYNGTACVQIYPGSGDNVYLCRFKYGEALLHLWFKADEQTNEIRTNWNGLWFPLTFATVLVAQNDTHVWKASGSQNANIIGQLYSQCGGWSNAIASKSNDVYLTAKIYNSQEVNLGPLLAGQVLFSAVVHPRNTATNNYIAQWTDTYAFYANQTGACTHFPFTYSAIQPNMNDCKVNGCDVTFILIGNSSIYTLQTNGFVYSGALRG